MSNPIGSVSTQSAALPESNKDRRARIRNKHAGLGLSPDDNRTSLAKGSPKESPIQTTIMASNDANTQTKGAKTSRQEGRVKDRVKKRA